MKRSEFMLGGEDFKSLKASQIMESEITACKSCGTWKDVARLMTEGGFGAVPVTAEDDTLLGLVTEHDLLKAMTEHEDVKDVSTKDIMAKGLVTVSEEDKVTTIMDKMVSNHLIRIPVTKNGKLVGVVARRDVIFAFLQTSMTPPSAY
ncbi:MAG: CBS domain-containing protein [Gammaproteobacteria bacterium]|nr:CBS domain-containing protein [Gammaproteobacteria bacterium]